MTSLKAATVALSFDDGTAYSYELVGNADSEVSVDTDTLTGVDETQTTYVRLVPRRRGAGRLMPHEEFCEYDGSETSAAGDVVDVCDGGCREFAETLVGIAPEVES